MINNNNYQYNSTIKYLNTSIIYFIKNITLIKCDDVLFFVFLQKKS